MKAAEVLSRTASKSKFIYPDRFTDKTLVPHFGMKHYGLKLADYFGVSIEYFLEEA